jgi:hypothetical protein
MMLLGNARCNVIIARYEYICVHTHVRAGDTATDWFQSKNQYTAVDAHHNASCIRKPVLMANCTRALYIRQDAKAIVAELIECRGTDFYIVSLVWRIKRYIQSEKNVFVYYMWCNTI